MGFAQAISHLLHLTNNNYAVPFVYASLVYVAAVGIMHWLVPRAPAAMGIPTALPADPRHPSDR